MNIFNNILYYQFLLYFYEKTGFFLQNIFVLRTAITLKIQDRYEKNEKLDGNILAFSADEILSYIKLFFPNNILIDIKQINNFIYFFQNNSSVNNDYLPRIINC